MDKTNESMRLFVSTDGGGNKNHPFDRAQAACLWLARKHNHQHIACAKASFALKFIIANLKRIFLMLLMFIYLLHMKNSAGSIVWNPSKRCMSALNNVLCSDTLCRVGNETNIEQELSQKKNTKALMESNPTVEIKKACIELLNPTLMQLKGRLRNCNFAKRKVKTCTHITKECALQEMKELLELFPFLPGNIETCKITGMFKKTEEGRKYQEMNFLSNMNALQTDKVNVCNCA